jgi:hypothetical protein
MIKTENYAGLPEYVGYTVTWAKTGDRDSFTYAVGGRGSINCSGIRVINADKGCNIRVVPMTSYFRESANIVIAIPPKEEAIAEVATAFISILDAYPFTKDTSFDYYLESSEKEAQRILDDKEKYSAFLQLPKHEFFRLYPSVTRITYAILSMELKGRLKELDKRSEG